MRFKSNESRALIQLLWMLAAICFLPLLPSIAQTDFDNLRIGTNTTFRSVAAGNEFQDALDAKTTNDYVRTTNWQNSNSTLQATLNVQDTNHPTVTQWQSSNTTLQANIAAVSGGLSSNKIVILAHRVASGQGGGSTTNAGVNVRPINVEIYDAGNHCVLLTTNNWSLDTGLWMYDFASSVFEAGNQTAILYDVTGGAAVDMSEGNFAIARNAVGDDGPVSIGSGIVRVSTTTNVFQIRHYVETTNTLGFGNNVGLGTSNVFARIRFIKLD